MENTENKPPGETLGAAPGSMTPDTPTPRTDLFYDDHYNGVSAFARPGYEFAQQLERELGASSFAMNELAPFLAERKKWKDDASALYRLVRSYVGDRHPVLADHLALVNSSNDGAMPRCSENPQPKK